MSKDYITNGGNFISKDGFGRYKINGQTASRSQVQQQIRQDGGKVHNLANADRKTRNFAEQQQAAMRQAGKRV